MSTGSGPTDQKWTGGADIGGNDPDRLGQMPERSRCADRGRVGC